MTLNGMEVLTGLRSVHANSAQSTVVNVKTK